MKSIYIVTPFILEGSRLFLASRLSEGFWPFLELALPLVLVVLSLIRGESLKKVFGNLGMYVVFRIGAFLVGFLLILVGIGLGDAGI